MELYGGIASIYGGIGRLENHNRAKTQRGRLYQIEGYGGYGRYMLLLNISKDFTPIEGTLYRTPNGASIAPYPPYPPYGGCR
jgi:hypothetical protein